MSEIIRRKDFAGGGITEEERVKMQAHAKMWIGRALRTTPIEPDKIVPAIKGLYNAAGLEEPEVVIVSSPLMMAFAGGVASAIWHWREEGFPTAIRTQKPMGPLYDAVRAACGDFREKAALRACNFAREAMAEAMTGKLDPKTKSPRNATDKFVMECVRRWYVAYQGGNMWAGYESYLTACRDILGLELPEHEKYKWWETCAIEGGFRWMHPKFCMVCDFPLVLKLDEENRPHCADGPSHKWRDGWALYHWRGVAVPEEWIESPDTIPPETALTHQNVEQRRAAAEIMGWEKVLSTLHAKTINEDPDPEIGTLVEVELPDAGRERFLRVKCGTGRMFALPVPPDMQTALEANAWTFNMDKELFKPEVRT